MRNEDQDRDDTVFGEQSESADGSQDPSGQNAMVEEQSNPENVLVEDVLVDVDEPLLEDREASLELDDLEINRRDVMRTGAIAGVGAVVGFSGGYTMGGESTVASGDHFVPPGQKDT